MTTLPQADIIRIAREFLAEAYEGPGDGWSWFVNAEPNAGVLGTIATLSATQASRALTPNGRSIAAHTEHLRWQLELVLRTIQGEPWNPDWSESWSVQEVNETEWQTLQANLRQAFNNLHTALQHAEATLDQPLDPQMLRGLLALAPHATHHLGSIRQMAKVVRTE